MAEEAETKATSAARRAHQQHQQSDEHYIYFPSYLPTRTHPLDRHQAKGGRSIASTFCLKRVGIWGWAAMRRRQALDRMKQHQAFRLHEGFSKSDRVSKVLAEIVTSVAASVQQQQQQPQREIDTTERPNPDQNKATVPKTSTAPPTVTSRAAAAVSAATNAEVKAGAVGLVATDTTDTHTAPTRSATANTTATAAATVATERGQTAS